MSRGLEAGDYEGVRESDHQLKGAGSSYGFDAITDIGRSLEQAAKEQSRADVAQWLRELAAYLEVVDVVYK